MAVGYGHARTRCRNFDARAFREFPVFYAAEYFIRLELRLFFFSADVGNDVIDDVPTRYTGVPRAGYRLHRGHHYALDIVAFLQERVNGGDIALDTAVRLHDDESFFPAARLLLEGDNVEMMCVYLGNKHGDIGSMAVRRCIRKYRHASSSVHFFRFAYHVLVRHFERGEHEGALACSLLHVGDIVYRKPGDARRYLSRDDPSVLERILVFLSRRLRRS